MSAKLEKNVLLQLLLMVMVSHITIIKMDYLILRNVQPYFEALALWSIVYGPWNMGLSFSTHRQPMVGY